jgi:hypothetical protein
MTDPERARLLTLVEQMRAEGPRYKSHDLGFVDSVSANRVDEWADELAEMAQPVATKLSVDDEARAALLPPVGQPASLHVELLALSVCLMRFDELNAGQTVRVIGVKGLVELIDAARTLVARHEAEAPVGQEEPQA